MNSPVDNQVLHAVTRRHFFRQCGVGLGSLALGSLFAQDLPGLAATVNPLAAEPGHFPARAKSVIFLFMAGGPSQLELFDYKPVLQKNDGQPIPESYMEGRRFAFMDTTFKQRPNLLGTRRKFAQHGACGAWVSECYPNLATVVDEMTFVKTVRTNQPNHAPAKIFLNTGSPRFGRPSMGSWVTYGIGSEADDLPGFVVLQSGPRGPRGGSPNWGNGFLPTAHQGVPFRTSGDPILSLSTPNDVEDSRQRRVIDTINELNRQRLAVTGDSEIAARISSYEMAYQLQTSAPELMDLSSETPSTLALYGVDEDKPSFGRNCLLARRLVERGVRFVQLYHTNWDHHGGSTENLMEHLDQVCWQTDQPCMALIRDLKQRGLFDQTLVIWGGEFGRTPMGEPRDTLGRNHHIETGTMWMAGGGVKQGFVLGETDELGFLPAVDPVHVHDIQATILHLLGLDHERLTFRFQGRDFRLTDVYGNVIHTLLA